MNKLIPICQALIIVTLLAVCFSCSKDSPAPVSTDPKLTTVSKTSVINGEIITITGMNFSKNYNGGSQIMATNASTADQVFLHILSRTETEIVAIMTGSGAGVAGTYSLSYISKPDANAPTYYPSALSVTVAAPAVGQFFASSTFTSSNVDKNADASFGVKNGSTTTGDYTLTLVGYNYETGASTESPIAVKSVTANGYGGTMDLVTFTVPVAQASGSYGVKVTYTTNTIAAGWGSIFSVN